MEPHTFLLSLLANTRFSMGRQLAAECLTGEENERIFRLKLNRNPYYSSLPLYQKEDVFEMIDVLLKKGLLEYDTLPGNSFIKILKLTEKGREEMKNPGKIRLNSSFEGYYKNIEKITDKDKEIFNELKDVLNGLSYEQKKAVILDSKNILCIAGAGSGKTRVLTKRAWFLATFKQVDEKKILAITFTRKARQEMMSRLEKLLPGNRIEVETFNSFCEKILRKKEKKIYGREYKVMTYSDKIKIILDILKEKEINIDDILNRYYTSRQLRSKERRTLFLGFVNDIFSATDYKKNNHLTDTQFLDLVSKNPDSVLASAMTDIMSIIKDKKHQQGLRDFTDQLIHTLDYFKESGDIPSYEHILVDEYQDINSLQFELLNLLNPKNLFAVGDPRQSIYGWRGAVIDYILDFEDNYNDAKIVQLTTNYRSSEAIVTLANKIIKTMKLPDLKAYHSGDDKDVIILEHGDEDKEAMFIAQSIKSLDIPRKQIFVLTRTNKQLDTISTYLDMAQIRYIKRTVEETNAGKNPGEDEITLATIHAIKGLESDVVYVAGATRKNHPCKASDHPLLESIKLNDTYDKFEEELRLFYVAVTRARKKLVINYSGMPTKYLDGQKDITVMGKPNPSQDRLFKELRAWRYDMSQELGVLPYQIFNDRTLNEICEIRPFEVRELNSINGFGQYKVRRWGSQIIALIRKYG